MKILYTNIGQLLQIRKTQKALRGDEMNRLPLIKNAFLVTNNQIIESFGPMTEQPNAASFDKIMNLEGKIMMPAWIDSHTHLVFAASRADEFVYKINGLTYEEIAAKGGGILNSAKKMEEIDEAKLFEQSMILLNEAVKHGTGAIEIKSGYGLSKDAELKMLRVIKKIKAYSPIPIKSTFLGAHAVPQKYKNNKQAYIDLLIDEILPVISEEKLADYIDVFCEKNYFTAEESARIMKAGIKYGLKPKIPL